MKNSSSGFAVILDWWSGSSRAGRSASGSASVDEEAESEVRAGKNANKTWHKHDLNM
jgi:hypothetical protein